MAVAQPQCSLKELYEDVIMSSASRFATSQSSDELGAALPGFLEVRNSLQRSRAKMRPKLPASRSGIRLQAPWTVGRDGGQFLLFDDGSEDRILGFGSEDAVKILCSAACVLMDGTFRVVPRLFSQMYTLHASFRNQVMPLLYFLLPNKEKNTYSRVFTLISTFATARGLLFNPQRFKLDYEIGMLKAIEENFPQARVTGCNFHYMQALYRRVQKYGLKKLYDEDETVKR